MKSSLRKLRGLVSIQRHDPNERRGHQPPAHLDELSQASQDMLYMRNYYDSLLSAAAATANSAYEFSEALQEMGTCLIEKTALDDVESGRVLLMLGKAQLELRKFVDSYRVHITQTITIPSESLLKELETVEEMKRQCDDKRNLFEFMLAAREKGRSRNTKGESFSSLQIQAAQEDYEEEATLFVFRLKSLKQGQSRSLLTQAARHHAAQLSFFRKGVKSLEVVEPHVKVIAEQQHIDYQFSGLQDEDSEDDDDDAHNDNDYRELSFDYGQNDHGQHVDSKSRNSMELDQVDNRYALTSTTETTKENLDGNQVDLLPFRGGLRAGSQSEPILAEKKYEPAERIKQMQPSTRMFHTYVLPTPVDAKISALAGSGNPDSAARLESNDRGPTQLWSSSEPNKFVKVLREDELSSPTRLSIAQSILKESNINSGPIRLPPPLAEGLLIPQFNPAEDGKINRQAFSGPLTSKAWPSKLTSSAMPARVSTSQPFVSPKVSPSASPPRMSSPKISELHELPRPPISSSKPRRPGLIGHSAPLVSRGQELSTTGKTPSIAHYKATPLPTPPGTMARSFSIPSSSPRTPMSTVAKLAIPYNQNMTKDFSSPPLTPILLPSFQPVSSASESVTHATKTGSSSIIRV